MYAVLTSKINGEPFLTISINSISDLDRVANYLKMMKLNAELYIENPNVPTVWTCEDIELHMR